MISFKKLLVTSAFKAQIPVLAELSICQKRNASSHEHYIKYGQGGRNSFNGCVATVFGATGFLGRYVVNRLAKEGTQIIVPFRGSEDDVRHLRLMGDLGQIVFLDFDLKDDDSIRRTMTNSNAVINMIGRDYSTRNYSMHDSLVGGAQSIAQAAKDAGVKKLVHVSSLNAKGSSSSYYLQAKAQSERVVADAFPEATFIRPAQFYGHEDDYLNKYAYMRKLKIGIPLVGNGWETTKRPVFVSDVAQGIVRSTLDGSTNGKTYELYGPEEYYLHDMVSFVLKMIRKPLKTFSVPMQLYSAVGLLGEYTPFDKRITRDMVVRQFLSDEVTEDAYTFEDLGMSPVNLNNAALAVLRRHRDYYHYDQNLDESEFCRPVTAYQ